MTTAGRLRWHKGTRYYEAELCQDLFGDHCVRLNWGRIGTACGRSLTRPCQSASASASILSAVVQKRLQRGYQLVGA